MTPAVELIALDAVLAVVMVVFVVVVRWRGRRDRGGVR